MNNWLRRTAPPEVKTWYRRVAGHGDRGRPLEVRRLRRMSRYTSGITDLPGTPTEFVDAASFLSAYHAIFVDRIYDFPADRDDPVILDCGANVGLAILFWKQHYPRARISAFEADPRVFATLARNCARWSLTDVHIERTAVWTSEGEMGFLPEGADAGRLVKHRAPEDLNMAVRTVRLRDFLAESVDLLKLDIEGAEVDVVLDCADRLNGVRNLFAEYHSFVNEPQRLDEMLSALRNAGFWMHLQSEFASHSPFVEHATDMGMDNRVNVFAWRR